MSDGGRNMEKSQRQQRTMRAGRIRQKPEQNRAPTVKQRLMGVSRRSTRAV